MNRHDRRARAAQGGAAPPASSYPKARVELHTPPESVPPYHLAAFLSALSHAWEAANKVPGATKPVRFHLVLEMDGRKVCGNAVESDGTEPPLGYAPHGVN
jgi:hypothetical protein